MRFFKLGGSYFVKNCWWLLLIAFLPAVFVGLLTGPYQLITFINNYPTTTISSFTDIFRLLMPVSWITIIFAILAILLVSIFVSVAVGVSENHMRSGKLKFKDIFSYVNNDILVALVNIVIIEITYLVLTFLFGSIMFLFHLILSGLSNMPSILNVVFATILCVVELVLFTTCEILFLLNIPNMISNGYSLKEGISSTAKLMSKNTAKLILSYLLPYVVIIPFVSLLAKTDALWVANIICFWLQIGYAISLTMTSYFELSDTSRYDNRKYYNYR